MGQDYFRFPAIDHLSDEAVLLIYDPNIPDDDESLKSRNITGATLKQSLRSSSAPNFFYGLSNGGDPPLPGSVLAAEVAAQIAAGMDPASIFFIYTGSEVVGVLTASVVMPAIIVQPLIALQAPAAARSAYATALSISVQPGNVLPVSSAVRCAEITGPSVVIQPSITLPSASAASDGSQIASVSMPSISVQPIVSTPDTASVRVAEVTAPLLEIPPVISLPIVSADTGDTSTSASVVMPSLTVQPSVALQEPSAARSAAVTLPSLSIQPTVALPSVSASAATGGPFTIDFETDMGGATFDQEPGPWTPATGTRVNNNADAGSTYSYKVTTAVGDGGEGDPSPYASWLSIPSNLAVSGNLTFRAKSPTSTYIQVQVDDVNVGASIALTPTYQTYSRALPSGSHTVKLIFTAGDGSVQTIYVDNVAGS